VLGASGFWKSGVANTLSTTSRAPAARAISATAAMSISSSVGLDGLSRKKARVSGRTAARHASRSGPSTSVEATPKRGRKSAMTYWHEPNKAREATTWSPARRSQRSAAVTAAMPLAIARAASAPSTRHMRSSNMATVGLA
jgi:hypothetical protein